MHIEKQPRLTSGPTPFDWKALLKEVRTIAAMKGKFFNKIA